MNDYISVDIFLFYIFLEKFIFSEILVFLRNSVHSLGVMSIFPCINGSQNFLIAKFNWVFGNFWYYILLILKHACIFKQIDTGVLNFAFKINGDKLYFISGKQQLMKNSAYCKVNSVNYIDKQTCMSHFFFLVSFCSWKCKLLIIGKFVKPGLLFACMLTMFPFHRRIARLNWPILFSGWNGCQSHLQGFEG